MKRRIILVLIAGAVALLAGFTWLMFRAEDDRTAFFLHTTLGSEGGDNHGRLMRWESPVRFQVVVAGNPALARQSLDIGLDIASRVSREASVVEVDGNFLIAVLPDPFWSGSGELMRALDEFLPGNAALKATLLARLRDLRAACAFFIQYRRPGEPVPQNASSPPFALTRAIVIIDQNLDPQVREAYITQEMAQAFGVPNDVPQSSPWETVFKDGYPARTLTELDAWTLRTLYDPRLSVGMSAAEVRKALRTLDGSGP